MLEIVSVAPGGTGAKLGLAPGDRIITINNEEIRDAIDYRFFIAEERVKLKICTPRGEIRNISFDKDPDDSLGIDTASFRIRRCRNRCIFCFVDQMPPGCRKPLYVKDEDFRASFLHGNYIALSALSEEDRQRIVRQRLSPLYISVHATEPDLRALMIGNRNAPPILESLHRLTEAGRMHTQIVLCPDINDGPHLMKTLDDLAGLFPAVASIAVVPVGLTAYRKGLYSLRPFTRAEARKVIHLVTDFGRKIKKQFGTRLAFPSDEFYIQAREPFPPLSFYEECAQRENGVGMVSVFLREVSGTRLPEIRGAAKIRAITGVSFGPTLEKALKRVREATGVRIEKTVVQNDFFGPLVTVAGLLAGRDILRALLKKRPCDLVLVPAEALKEDEEVFLDGMTLQDLSRRLSTPVLKVEGFRHMLSLIRKTRRSK